MKQSIPIPISKGQISPVMIDFTKNLAKLGAYPDYTFRVEAGGKNTIYPDNVTVVEHRDTSGYISQIEVLPPIDDNGLVLDNLILIIKK